jgi:hypothetical protein
MKILTFTISVLALLLAFPIVSIRAAEDEGQFYAPPDNNDLNISYFYGVLNPYGSWFNDETHGWVWQPRQALDPNWRPYVNAGHWTSTDEGWYWASNYSWGWAPFHYGRWYHAPERNWVWVPDTVWAPAWVSWRESNAFYGWAPLPPEAVFNVGAGFRGVAVNFGFGLGADAFTFVPCGNFLALDFGAFIVPRERVDTIFRGTNIVRNSYETRNGRVIDKGFDVARVSERTGERIRPLHVADADIKPGQRLAGIDRRSGNEIRAYRPDISKAAPMDPVQAAKVNAGYVQRLNPNDEGALRRERNLEQERRNSLQEGRRGGIENRTAPNKIERRNLDSERDEMKRPETRGAPERNGMLDERKSAPGREDGGRLDERKSAPGRENGGNIDERKSAPGRENGGNMDERKSAPGRENGGNMDERKSAPGRENGGNMDERKSAPGRENGGRLDERKSAPGRENGGRLDERRPER